jgi:signal transduction histidine kinase
VDRTQQVANVHIHLLINVEEDILKKEFVLSLYRIIQELINNSVKHSGCSQIQLRVEEEIDLLKLQYADDGVGYPYETLESAQGMGLRNISGRVYAHNGRVNLLRTRPGFGILAEFPKKHVCTESADRGRSQSVL